MLKRYQAGLDLKDIACVSGQSAATVCLKIRSIDPEYTKSKHWRKVRREAMLYYIKGENLRSVGRRFGVTYACCQKWFKAMHPDYARIVRSGVFASSADFIKAKHSARRYSEAESIEAWLINELPRIILAEASNPLLSMNERQERSIRLRESGRFGDYRDQF